MDDAPRALGEELTFTFIRPPGRESVFTARLLQADSELIILEQIVHLSKPLTVSNIEVLPTAFRAVWFLFNGRRFDIGRFYRPDGTLSGYYTDICEPVRWSGNDPHSLEPIIDLFLDLWITIKGEFFVLDEDEFEEAVRSRILTADQVAAAKESLEQCVAATIEGTFPPDIVRSFTS